MPMGLSVGTMPQPYSAYPSQECRNAHRQDWISWRQPRQQELCRTCVWWVMLQHWHWHELAQVTLDICLWNPEAQCTDSNYWGRMDWNYWGRMGIVCRKERRDKPSDSDVGVFMSSGLECWAAECRWGNPRSCLTELTSPSPFSASHFLHHVWLEVLR